jgi:exodeoxyribonuclease V alpha subunit
LAVLRAAADIAQQTNERALRALAEAGRRREDELGKFGALGQTPDPAGTLANLERDITAAEHGLAESRARITQLQAELALAAQPADRLAAERDAWRAARDADGHRRAPLTPRPTAQTSGVPRPQRSAKAVRRPLRYRPGLGDD